MKVSKTLFCSLKFQWALERIYSKFIENFDTRPQKSSQAALGTSGLKYIRVVSNGWRMCGLWLLAVLSCWILSDHLWKANIPEGIVFMKWKNYEQ
jgi:hypothetical protein